MSLRKHITRGLVDAIRNRLSVDLHNEPVDAYDHELVQIDRCLHIFVDFIEGSADTDDGSPTDSLLLRSILERVNTLANIIVPKADFETKLDLVVSKISSLTDSNDAYVSLIGGLVSDFKDAISKVNNDPNTELDFSAEAAKLDAVLAKVDTLNTSNASVTSEVNSAIASVTTTVSSAPVATTPDTPAVTPPSTGIVNQTPAPVDGGNTPPVINPDGSTATPSTNASTSSFTNTP